MSHPVHPAPNTLPLLYQHAQYSSGLARTHQTLGKLYKKLARVERVLVEKEGRKLTRNDKKKWQYTRTLSKRAIANLESEQATLHQQLLQCNGLIASYEYSAHDPHMPPWSSAPLSPFPFTPYTPAGTFPWMSASPAPMSGADYSDAQTRQPLDWDSSMIRERRLGSSHTSLIGSALSYSPALVDERQADYANNVFAHELLSPVLTATHPAAKSSAMTAESTSRSSTTSTNEKRDVVPSLRAPVSSDKSGAQLDLHPAPSHKRCYSADAVAGHMLAAPSPYGAKSRPTSVGALKVRRVPEMQEEEKVVAEDE